jgi:hypothetical protein
MPILAGAATVPALQIYHQVPAAVAAVALAVIIEMNPSLSISFPEGERGRVNMYRNFTPLLPLSAESRGGEEVG